MLQERCKEAGISYYNPHSFRHAAVAYMSEKGLTEADKRSISLVLGHENIGTTFGSYGYGHISPKDAVERVKAMKSRNSNNPTISMSDEELGKIVREALSGNNSKS
jgi:integrase